MRTCPLLALLLLCGCSGSGSDAGTEIPIQNDPDYGAEASLKEVYRFGFEVSVLHLCEKSREDCVSSLPLDGGCWIEFTNVAATELKRLAPNIFEADNYGEAWMEGTGRIAREPGNFGHLNDYSCQVELTHVRIVDGGPPFMFRPPPPQP